RRFRAGKQHVQRARHRLGKTLKARRGKPGHDFPEGDDSAHCTSPFAAARRLATSRIAAEALSVIACHWPCWINDRGAIQEPPTAWIKGSSRYVRALAKSMPPNGMNRTPRCVNGAAML